MLKQPQSLSKKDYLKMPYGVYWRKVTSLGREASRYRKLNKPFTNR